MGKGEKQKKDTSVMEESILEGPTYEDKIKFVSVIAKPMASKKLTKKVYKIIKKGSKQKTFVRIWKDCCHRGQTHKNRETKSTHQGSPRELHSMQK